MHILLDKKITIFHNFQVELVSINTVMVLSIRAIQTEANMCLAVIQNLCTIIEIEKQDSFYHKIITKENKPL